MIRICTNERGVGCLDKGEIDFMRSNDFKSTMYVLLLALSSMYSSATWDIKFRSSRARVSMWLSWTFSNFLSCSFLFCSWTFSAWRGFIPRSYYNYPQPIYLCMRYYTSRCLCTSPDITHKTAQNVKAKTKKSTTSLRWEINDRRLPKQRFAHCCWNNVSMSSECADVFMCPPALYFCSLLFWNDARTWANSHRFHSDPDRIMQVRKPRRAQSAAATAMASSRLCLRDR